MVNGNNVQYRNTKLAAIKYRLKKELNFCASGKNPVLVDCILCHSIPRFNFTSTPCEIKSVYIYIYSIAKH